MSVRIYSEDELNKRKDRYEREGKQKMQRIFGPIGILIGLFLLIGGMVSFYNPSRDVDGETLHAVSGRISLFPETQSPGRGEYIKFKLSNYPYTEFNITGFALKAKLKPFAGSLSLGDSVFLQLTDYQFQKLQKEKGRARVSIVSFVSKDQEYVLWSDYVKESIKDNRLGILIAFIGSAYCIYSVRTTYIGFRPMLRR